MDSVASSQDSPGAGYTQVKEYHGITIWLRSETGEFAAKVKPERARGAYARPNWTHRRSLRDLEREIDKIVEQRPVKAFGFHYGNIVAYTIVRFEKGQFIDENGHRVTQIRPYNEAAIEKIRELQKQRTAIDREIQDTLSPIPYLTMEDLIAAPVPAPSEEASV